METKESKNVLLSFNMSFNIVDCTIKSINQYSFSLFCEHSLYLAHCTLEHNTNISRKQTAVS